MKAFFTLIILFFAVAAFAQSHTYKAGCRYYVAPASATASKDIHAGRLGEDMCPACLKDAKAEEVARIKEKDRVDGIALAKKEAARKAEKEAADKANTERINKIYNSSTKVEYAIPKSDGSKKSRPGTTHINAQPIHKTRMFGDFDSNTSKQVFKGENSEVILSSDEWRAVWPFSNEYYATNVQGKRELDDLPTDVGIIRYMDEVKSINQNGSGKTKTFVPYNLINAKGELMFPNNSVSQIDYCGHQFFLIGFGGWWDGDSWQDDAVCSDMKIYDCLNKRLLGTSFFRKENNMIYGMYQSPKLSGRYELLDINTFSSEKNKYCKKVNVALQNNDWLIAFIQQAGEQGMALFVIDKKRQFKKIGVISYADYKDM